MNEKTRTGRYGEMKALLDEVVDPAETGRVVNSSYNHNLLGRGEQEQQGETMEINRIGASAGSQCNGQIDTLASRD